MNKIIKASVTFSENFKDIMILINADFLEIIKEDKHFFEKLGKKLDADLKEDDFDD